ncbi:hypothetical protein F4775DRAFT_568025 [Biscogniauxia sp. FL1348]|nr:hypothetical protein F4775DRAFT_568025 [Biscogniauxia sp. FL1348]
MFLLRSPSPSPSPSSPSLQQFSRFPDLPPEIRHQIWLAAVPSPGINFFNVHVIPNDHPGANRSTSPPLARLDVRRLDIDDDDDEHVATYDPSAWRARDALRRTCREARLVCAIPDTKSAHVILTRPRRGLFVRAGDGQLRCLTPLREPPRRLSPTSVNANGGVGGDSDVGLAAAAVTVEEDSTVDATTQQPSSTKNLGERETEKRQQQQQQQTEPEPLVYRTIRVHIDDMFCLSIENCSFNLPYEESPILRGASDFDYRGCDYDEDEDEDADADLGWVYDPQFHPPLPSSIPLHRYCINLARGNRVALRAVQDIITGLIQTISLPPSLPSLPSQPTQPQHLVMLDSVTQDPGERTLAELNPALAAGNEGKKDNDAAVAVFRDRYGDRYAPLPWDSRDLQARYRLTKLWPEANDIRERYLRSALLRSPKRLHTARSLYGQSGV